MTTTIPQSRTVTCDCCSKEITSAMPSYSLAVPVERREQPLPSPTTGFITQLVYRFQYVWERKELDFCSPDCMEVWFRSAEFDKTHEHFKPAEPLGTDAIGVFSIPASCQTGG